MPDHDTSDKGLTTLGSELWNLTLRYAKQETLDPLKALGRYLATGIGGALALGLGLAILGLGVLRAVQLEVAPHLSGNWSWVPYLVVAVLASGMIVVLARGIGTEKRRVEAERRRLTKQGS